MTSAADAGRSFASSALESPVFRRYAAIVAGLLVASGLVLAFLRWGLRRDVRSVRATYLSWWVMAPVVFGVLLLGRTAVIVGVALLSVAGVKEFARATGLCRDWGLTGAVYLGVLGVAVASLVRDPSDPTRPGWGGLYLALPVYAINLLLLLPIVRDRTHGQLQAVSLAILAFLYLGWMLGHLGFLANSPHRIGYLLFLLFAVEVNDVAAFVFGKWFGRRPLRAAISPRKTWEGALGAAAVSLALPWVLRFSFPHFGAPQLLLSGLLVGVGGQLGDLSLSFIKRDLGVKDMGASIPGHGGLLDRIDSLLYTAPLFAHMVNYFYGVHGP